MQAARLVPKRLSHPKCRPQPQVAYIDVIQRCSALFHILGSLFNIQVHL